MNKQFLILFIFFIIILPGCKTSKQLGNLNDKQLLKKMEKDLQKDKINYTYFSGRARIHVKNADINQTATVELKMKKDSMIWGSVTVIFGIEAGRFFISEKKFTMIDKINGKYYEYPIEELVKKYALPEITLSEMQSLILGEFAFNLKDFDLGMADSSSISLQDIDNGILKRVIFSKITQELSGYYFQKQLDGKKNIQLTYREKIQTGKAVIPKIIELWAKLPEESYLKLNYFSAQFNNALLFDTAIPDNYEKVE